MDDALVGAGLHSFLRIICLDYIEKFQLLIYYYSAIGIGPADTESSIDEYFAFQTSCSKPQPIFRMKKVTEWR